MTVETVDLITEDFLDGVGDAVVDQIIESKNPDPDNEVGGYNWLVDQLPIDELRLDDAHKEQAELFHIVTTRVVEINHLLNALKFEKEQAKIRTEALIAGASLSTRANADATGAKMTESKVEETVKSNKSVVDAKLALATADYEISETFTELLKWESLRKSYEERSVSLKGMVNLITSGYAAYTRRL